jgi:hypothetical protein
LGSVFGVLPPLGAGGFTTGVLFGFGAGVGSVIGVNVVFGSGVGLSVSSGVGDFSTSAGVGSGMFDGVDLVLKAELDARFAALLMFGFDAPVGTKKIKPIKMKNPTTAPENAASKTPIKVLAPFEAILNFILSDSSD